MSTAGIFDMQRSLHLQMKETMFCAITFLDRTGWAITLVPAFSKKHVRCFPAAVVLL